MKSSKPIWRSINCQVEMDWSRSLLLEKQECWYILVLLKYWTRW